MQPSITQTLSVPIIGNGNNPSRLTQAGTSPMRVVINNTGGNLVVLAHDVAALTDVNSLGGCFQLQAGKDTVIVLAPSQSLFAAAQGAGGQVSIAVSEAFPTQQWMES